MKITNRDRLHVHNVHFAIVISRKRDQEGQSVPSLRPLAEGSLERAKGIEPSFCAAPRQEIQFGRG
jgi:hypothetical protein